MCDMLAITAVVLLQLIWVAVIIDTFEQVNPLMPGGNKKVTHT